MGSDDIQKRNFEVYCKQVSCVSIEKEVIYCTLENMEERWEVKI